jgi:hypothetical protein
MNMNFFTCTIFMISFLVGGHWPAEAKKPESNTNSYEKIWYSFGYHLMTTGLSVMRIEKFGLVKEVDDDLKTKAEMDKEYLLSLNTNLSSLLYVIDLYLTQDYSKKDPMQSSWRKFQTHYNGSRSPFSGVVTTTSFIQVYRGFVKQYQDILNDDRNVDRNKYQYIALGSIASEIVHGWWFNGWFHKYSEKLSELTDVLNQTDTLNHSVRNELQNILTLSMEYPKNNDSLTDSISRIDGIQDKVRKSADRIHAHYAVRQ